MRPKKGFEWNPVLKWPVNKPCFCGSGRKFKKCHRDVIPYAVEKEKAEALQKWIDKFGYIPPKVPAALNKKGPENESAKNPDECMPEMQFALPRSSYPTPRLPTDPQELCGPAPGAVDDKADAS